MGDAADHTPAAFYRTAAGAEPVRDWLKGLPREDRRKIGADLQRAQYRWPVGMPLCRPLGAGLWEIRTSLASKREARVLLCHHEGVLVVLHGLIKKTQAIPPGDLKLARERRKEVEDGDK